MKSKTYPEQICRIIPSDLPLFDLTFHREVIGINYHIDRCLLEFGKFLLSIIQSSDMYPNIFEVAVMNNDENQEFYNIHQITGDEDVKKVRYYDLDFVLLHMMKFTKTPVGKIVHKDANNLVWLQPYYNDYGKAKDWIKEKEKVNE